MICFALFSETPRRPPRRRTSSRSSSRSSETGKAMKASPKATSVTSPKATNVTSPKMTSPNKKDTSSIGKVGGITRPGGQDVSNSKPEVPKDLPRKSPEKLPKNLAPISATSVKQQNVVKPTESPSKTSRDKKQPEKPQKPDVKMAANVKAIKEDFLTKLKEKETLSNLKESSSVSGSEKGSVIVKEKGNVSRPPLLRSQTVSTPGMLDTRILRKASHTLELSIRHN